MTLSVHNIAPNSSETNLAEFTVYIATNYRTSTDQFTGLVNLHSLSTPEIVGSRIPRFLNEWLSNNQDKGLGSLPVSYNKANNTFTVEDKDGVYQVFKMRSPVYLGYAWTCTCPYHDNVIKGTCRHMAYAVAWALVHGYSVGEEMQTYLDKQDVREKFRRSELARHREEFAKTGKTH